MFDKALPSRMSPSTRARIAGLFYLLEMAAGALAVSVARKLFILSDATATAHNILSHQSLFLFAVVTNLLQFAAYIVVTVLLYELLKPVNKTVSLLAAVFSAMGCAIGAIASLLERAPLSVLSEAPHLTALSAPQLAALAMLFIKLFGAFFNASFVFFGFYCVLVGYLIYRSTFLPRFLGVGMTIAGLGWLTFIWPPLNLALSPYVYSVGLGELALTTWLIAAGVSSARWLESNGLSRQAV